MAFLLVNNSKGINSSYQNKQIWSTIHNYIIEDNIHKILVVVPTSRLSKYYTSKIINEYTSVHHKPLINFKVISLEKLIKNIANKILITKDKYRFISEGFALSLFEEAISNSKLEYFTNSSMSNTLKNKLFKIITGLRKDGINSNIMFQDYEEYKENNLTKKSSLTKMNDMAIIFDAYENILSEKYIDNSGLFSAVLNKLKEIDFSLKNLYPDIELVLFNEFSEFNEPDANILSYLANKELAIAIQIDFSMASGPLLGGYETTILKLAKNGYKIVEVESDKENQQSIFIRENLFKHRGFKEKTDIFNDHITIINNKNRLDEVKFIGKLIKKLNIEDNIDLNKIAVCFRNPDEYASLFREVFYQYNIPSNITDRISLNSSPLIIGIFALFDIIINDFNTIDIRRAFHTDYFSKINNPNNDTFIEKFNNISIENLVNISKQLRLSNGFKYIFNFDKWIDSFRKALNLRKEIINNYPENNDNDNNYEKLNLENEIKNIEKTIKDLKIIYNLFNIKKNEEFTAEEFVNWIKENILIRFNLVQKIIDKYDSIATEFENRNTAENILHFENIERESQAYYTFFLLLEEFKAIYNERFPNEKFRFYELVDKLKTTVTGKKFQLREKTNYGVTITSIEQIRGIPFDVTILCGLDDSQFPIKFRNEIFLVNESKDSEIKHEIKERMHFYQFLMNNKSAYGNNKQIYLTYPEYDGNNKLIRSPFIDYLLNITSLSENNKIFSTLDYSKNKGEFVNYIDNINASILELSQIEALEKLDLDPIIKRDLDTAIQYSKFNNYINNSLSNLDTNGNDKLFLQNLPDNFKSFLNGFKDKIYSPTELDTYASCGVRYLLLRILKVSTSKEIEISLSKLEIGNIIHNILFQFYQRIQTIQNDNKNEIKLVKLEPENKNEYLSIIKEIANDLFSKYNNSHPLLDLDLIRIVGDNQTKGLLEIWLDYELEKIQNFDKLNKFHPALFEEEFGEFNQAYNKKFITLMNENKSIKISGKIDRIEFNILEDEIQFIVADYKSNASKQKKIKDINDFKAFQIPLYLAAAEKHLKQNFKLDKYKISPIAGIYYSYESFDKATKNNPAVGKIVISDINSGLTNKVENINELLENTINAASDIASAISNGNFSLSKEGISVPPCRYCEFPTICRIKDNLKNDSLIEDDENY